MSKNITIAEGENAKSFTGVAKLQTNLIEGGTQNWVPEDEAGLYADLTELQVSENGIYNAQDADVDGFSFVAVAVPGGEIPGGKEIKGIASEDVSLYQTVKVVQGKQDLTKVTNDTQEGWLRNSNNLVYRLVNNKYNGYNVTTGALKSKGTSTVYSATIFSEYRAVALRLDNIANGTKGTRKIKFLFDDGKSCSVDLECTNIKGYGYNNNLIAIAYEDDVTGEEINYRGTMNVYNKSGKLLTAKMGDIQFGWGGWNDAGLNTITPISKNKVTAILTISPNWGSIWSNCVITGDRTTDVKSNKNALATPTGNYFPPTINPGDWTNFRSLGFYGGKLYVMARRFEGDDKYTKHIMSISAQNLEGSFKDVSGDLDDKFDSGSSFGFNQYGHFQAYVDGKYYLYNIKDLSPVYDKDTLENSASHSLLESDKYLVFGRTYRKSSEDMIIPTNVYPDKHSDDTVLGIMKEDCEGGEEGTVIVLFE